MPRTSESTLSKLLRLIDQLTPEQIQIAQDILDHAERKLKGESTTKTQGRKKKTGIPSPSTAQRDDSV